MNITLNIEAPGLVNAIQSLADALSNTKVSGLTNTQPAIQVHTPEPIQQVAPQQTESVAQPVPTAVPTQVQPIQQQAQTQQTDPVQQPQVVPTSAPSYDMNQLAVAATQLMDAGKQNALLSLLASFGVNALMQLPQEQYGAFATKLREMGAKI